MDPRFNVVAGFVASGVIAAGGGSALALMSSKLEAPVAQMAVLPRAEGGDFLVRELDGEVFVLGPAGGFRRAREGDTMYRPAGVRIDQLGGRARIERGRVAVIASHAAELTLAAGGGGFDVQLRRGRALIESPGRNVATHVHDLGLTVVGQEYGVWVRRDRTVVGVVRGTAEIRFRGLKQEFGEGREITVNLSGLSPAALLPRLEIAVDRVARQRNGRYAMFARTAPNAMVLVRQFGILRPVEVRPDGSFAVEIESETPIRGELMAVDSVGRLAEVDRPSVPLGEVSPPMPENVPVASPDVVELVPEPAVPEDEAAEPGVPPPPAAAPPPVQAEAAPAPKAVAPARVKPAEKPRAAARAKRRGALVDDDKEDERTDRREDGSFKVPLPSTAVKDVTPKKQEVTAPPPPPEKPSEDETIELDWD